MTVAKEIRVQHRTPKFEENRRATPRVRYMVPCSLLADGQEYLASTINLSLGGALLTTPASESLPEHCELVLGEEAETHAVAVSVAHRSELLVGLRFQKLTPAALQFVRRVVEANTAPAR